MKYGIYVGNDAETSAEFTNSFIKVLKTLKEIGLKQNNVVPIMKVFTDKWSVSNMTISNCSINADNEDATL